MTDTTDDTDEQTDDIEWDEDHHDHREWIEVAVTDEGFTVVDSADDVAASVDYAIDGGAGIHRITLAVRRGDYDPPRYERTTASG